MSVRYLVVLVLVLCGGTAASVSWYLEGENEARAELRATEPPIRHLPRTAPDTGRRPTARWTRPTSRPRHAASSPAESAPAPSTWWLGTGTESSTALEPVR